MVSIPPSLGTGTCCPKAPLIVGAVIGVFALPSDYVVLYSASPDSQFYGRTNGMQLIKHYIRRNRPRLTLNIVVRLRSISSKTSRYPFAGTHQHSAALISADVAALFAL